MTAFLSTSDYLNLPNSFYKSVVPTAAINPKYTIFNKKLSNDLDLDYDYMTSQKGLDILSGKNTENLSPFSQAYMGHQFGHLTMLGDGRAILLGQINQQNELQLKGSGHTPFSRSGDGMATIGPMIREYIFSEAMYNLNIPTTRILAVIETGRQIMRKDLETGALAARITSSHLRVGTFQYAHLNTNYTDLKALSDYAINKHYSHLKQTEAPYLSLFKTVIKRQAELIANWQLIGFIHGVMNTDNMTISGETIDYGPCAFMDVFKPNQVFSSIDLHGRYAYNQQPNIGGWNLARLAESLLPLFSNDEQEALFLAETELKKYTQLFEHYFHAGLLKKIGLTTLSTKNINFAEELLRIMAHEERDFTETFRALTRQDTVYLDLTRSNNFKEWYDKWLKLISSNFENAVNQMKKVNPAVIPRNYLVEEAILQIETTGKQEKLQALLALIKNPFDYNEIQLNYTFPESEKNRDFKTYCGT